MKEGADLRADISLGLVQDHEPLKLSEGELRTLVFKLIDEAETTPEVKAEIAKDPLKEHVFFERDDFYCDFRRTLEMKDDLITPLATGRVDIRIGKRGEISGYHMERVLLDAGVDLRVGTGHPKIGYKEPGDRKHGEIIIMDVNTVGVLSSTQKVLAKLKG